MMDYNELGADRALGASHPSHATLSRPVGFDHGESVEQSVLRAIDACGGTHSAEDMASGYARGYNAALDAAMREVERLFARRWAKDKDVFFAWTATSDYRFFPQYINLTGNRLSVRGPEVDGMMGPHAVVELPAEAMAELRAAITQADTRRMVETAKHGSMRSTGSGGPEGMRQNTAANSIGDVS